MNTPLHASISVGEKVPHRYFAPPSTPDRPITKVEAYFNGKTYLFDRSTHGEPWTLLKIV